MEAPCPCRYSTISGKLHLRYWVLFGGLFGGIDSSSIRKPCPGRGHPQREALGARVTPSPWVGCQWHSGSTGYTGWRPPAGHQHPELLGLGGVIQGGRDKCDWPEWDRQPLWDQPGAGGDGNAIPGSSSTQVPELAAAALSQHCD